MKPHAVVRAIVLLVLLPLIVIAQGQRDAAPLKHWQAPLYWQPTRAESRAAATAAGVRSGELTTEVARAGDVTADTVPTGALVFVGMTPCRIADTRDGAFPVGFGPPSLSGGATRTFAIQSPGSPCPVPSTAQAYSFNITVVPPGASFPGNVNPSGALSYLTIWPTGVPQPVVSTLNSFLGTVVANAAIVPAGTGGSVDVFVSHGTNLIIDINGYYAPLSAITLTQGTATAPALNFSGDAGTGIYSSGAGTLNIATGGTSRLAIRPDGDLDLAGSIRKGGTMFLHNLGTQNTGVGLGALSVNTTGGGNNTATGSGALGANTIGEHNTANGSRALLSNTTGANNTATGSQALSSNTTGGSNTATGRDALYSNTTGLSNTANGLGALVFNTTGDDNTAIGQSALYANSTGQYNTATGSAALLSNTTGNYNTAIGRTALISNSTGSGNTAIGYLADVTSGSLVNATAIGSQALVNASNKIRLGSSSVTVLESQVGLTVVSDKNAKENFRPVNAEGMLKKVAGLSVPSWNYIGHDPKEFRHYGPMAQDFFAAFGEDEMGRIGSPTTINSSDMSGILMLAVQALEKRSTDLQNDNDGLRSENKTLEERIRRLEEALNVTH